MMRNRYDEITITERNETESLVCEVVNTAFNVVCGTMGPNSGVVLVNDTNKPTVTKDGVTVARSLDFGEPRKDLIGKLITSAATRVDQIVGDGTTTTVFMVNELFNRFQGNLTFKNIRLVDSLIEKTKEILFKEIIPVTPQSPEFERMLKTTTNYREDIYVNIIKLFNEYKSPNVNLIAGAGHPKDEITVEKDIVFEGEYPSPHCRPNTYKSILKLEKATVLLLDIPTDELDNKWVDNISVRAVSSKRPLIIVARSFESAGLNKLIGYNKEISHHSHNGGELTLIPFTLHAPGTSGSAMFKDLSDITGSPVYTSIPDDAMLDTVFSCEVNDFTVSNKGIIFDADNSKVKEKVEGILANLVPIYEEMTIVEKASVLGKISQRRISRLRAENVTIIVSGFTENEISERYFLYEDACKAAETSLRFGVIPGIGYGYNKVAEKLVEDIIIPLQHNLDDHDHREYVEVVDCFILCLLAPYLYLTDKPYFIYKEGEYIYIPGNGIQEWEENRILKNTYFDMVTELEEEVPTTVFDNGGAAFYAIESAWSVVKGIGRLRAILGRSDVSYTRKK